jgi:hypothetical protein
MSSEQTGDVTAGTDRKPWWGDDPFAGIPNADDSVYGARAETGKETSS